MKYTLTDLIRMRLCQQAIVDQKADAYLRRKVIPYLVKHPLKTFKTSDFNLVQAARRFGLNWDTAPSARHLFVISIPDAHP